MSTTPIVQGEQSPSDAGVRTFMAALRLDPLMLLATIGLMVCSLVTIAHATQDDIPGSPDYYVIRQGIYFTVGMLLMLAISRADYSRLRELKFGLYGLMIGGILLVLALGTASRGSRRWIELPFFNFQPSELGKLLLILTLAAFAVDRYRRISDRDTTVRVMLIALVPAALVMLQPDLGTGLVYVVIAIATYVRFYNLLWLGERVTANLRREVFDHLLSLPPGWFEMSRTGAFRKSASV